MEKIKESRRKSGRKYKKVVEIKKEEESRKIEKN